MFASLRQACFAVANYTKARLAFRLCRAAPLPLADLRHIFTVFIDVLFVLNQLILQLLLEVPPPRAGLRQAINGIHREMEAIKLIEHGHVESGRDRTLFLIAANVNAVMIGTAVG